MNENDLRTLHNTLASEHSQEEIARALLTMTLDAAPPEVADAVRVCAVPTWFNVERLALLLEKETEDVQPLIEAIAEFSFVIPRRVGYVYHEATRERLLAWWRAPAHRERLAALEDKMISVGRPLAPGEILLLKCHNRSWNLDNVALEAGLTGLCEAEWLGGYLRNLCAGGILDTWLAQVLGKAFGTSAEFWLNAEINYRQWNYQRRQNTCGY